MSATDLPNWRESDDGIHGKALKASFFYAKEAYFMVKIGHASIDERGKISGGKTGNQTGKEVCTRDWYYKPWNVLLICKDKALAKRAAAQMKSACANKRIGYDQNQRLTAYNSAVKNGKSLGKAEGETDCSALVSACYKLSGLDISASLTTSTIRSAFKATGKFEIYTDAAHLSSDAYAETGALYLSEGHHVVMALENGEKAGKKVSAKSNPYAEPVKNVKKGQKGNAVKWVQWKLNQSGISLVIDGEFGEKTLAAVKKFQKSKKLEADGIVGKKTRTALKKAE